MKEISGKQWGLAALLAVCVAFATVGLVTIGRQVWDEQVNGVLARVELNGQEVVISRHGRELINIECSHDPTFAIKQDDEGVITGCGEHEAPTTVAAN